MIVPLPPGETTLTATVDVDPWSTPAYLWEILDGDGVTIDDPTAAETTAHFATTGSKQLAFTATIPQSGTFLTDFDGKILALDDHVAIPVLGLEDGPGVAPDVSASQEIHVTVVPAVAGPTPPTVRIGRDLHIRIAGVEYAVGRLDVTKGASLQSITETRDANPNTASLTAIGFQPREGQVVELLLDDARIFAGRVLRDGSAFEELWEHQRDTVTVVDWTWDLKRWRVTASFKDASVGTVAAAIVAQAPGFTLVVSGGGTVTINFDNVDCASALEALCQQAPPLGWTVDYVKVVRIRAFDPTAMPEPITYAHPTVDGFQRQGELGSWVSQLRVWGASTTVSVDAAPYQSGIFISDDLAFGTEGSSIRLSGLISNAGQPNEQRDVSFETAFQGVQPYQAGLSAALDTSLLISDPTDLDAARAANPCLSDEDLLRHYLVTIRCRAIRVTATDAAPGLAVGTYTYYATYVTNRGESHWMQQLTCPVGGTGLFMSRFVALLPGGELAGGAPHELRFNAVEFVCDAMPITLQRINLYRQASGGGDVGGHLIGSLTAKGTLGELGTHMGEEDPDRAPSQLPPPGPGEPPTPGTNFVQYHPVTLGQPVAPSSNTLVDAGEPIAEALPLPATDVPLPACPADPNAVAPEDPDPTAPPPTPPAPVPVYLQGASAPYLVPKGARVQRFRDVIDGSAQARLATILDDSGIIHGPAISGDYATVSDMDKAGRAAIAAANQAAEGVRWTSREETHPGTLIAVYVPPRASGEYLIQTVTITEFETVGCDNGQKSYPRYTATAEPRYASIVGRLT